MNTFRSNFPDLLSVNRMINEDFLILEWVGGGRSQFVCGACDDFVQVEHKVI